METIVSSAKKEVIISGDRPTTLIGERINPTGKKKMAEDLRKGDFELVRLEAREEVDIPLCIDSGDPKALEAALKVYKGKALVNSVNGAEHSMETVLPLVKEFDAAVDGKPIIYGAR